MLQGSFARIFHAGSLNFLCFFKKISLRALMLHVKSSCSFDQGLLQPETTELFAIEAYSQVLKVKDRRKDKRE